MINRRGMLKMLGIAPAVATVAAVPAIASPPVTETAITTDGYFEPLGTWPRKNTLVVSNGRKALHITHRQPEAVTIDVDIRGVSSQHTIFGQYRVSREFADTDHIRVKAFIREVDGRVRMVPFEAEFHDEPDDRIMMDRMRKAVHEQVREAMDHFRNEPYLRG